MCFGDTSKQSAHTHAQPSTHLLSKSAAANPLFASSHSPLPPLTLGHGYNQMPNPISNPNMNSSMNSNMNSNVNSYMNSNMNSNMNSIGFGFGVNFGFGTFDADPFGMDFGLLDTDAAAWADPLQLPSSLFATAQLPPSTHAFSMPTSMQRQMQMQMQMPTSMSMSMAFDAAYADDLLFPTSAAAMRSSLHTNPDAATEPFSDSITETFTHNHDAHANTDADVDVDVIAEIFAKSEATCSLNDIVPISLSISPCDLHDEAPAPNLSSLIKSVTQIPASASKTTLPTTVKTSTPPKLSTTTATTTASTATSFVSSSVRKTSKTKEASRRSRLRKKIYVEGLEKVAKDLESQHGKLEQQLITLATENRTLKEQLLDLRSVIMHTTHYPQHNSSTSTPCKQEQTQEQNLLQAWGFAPQSSSSSLSCKSLSPLIHSASTITVDAKRSAAQKISAALNRDPYLSSSSGSIRNSEMIAANSPTQPSSLEGSV
eukprot:TRINITY_DN8826_c0_g1_i5.p1 TRINITY_DN8826_c0_g1~~TRINITY_DN8826_c0_g1_i5.p1  ORF type:complete len:486 (+),score=126.87 TRINITY_DN8826_c0_g1_i5:49-1506(+)